MQVNIVIPAYNAQKYLSSAIESVLAQTLSDWQLIVVNDGSTDGTGAIAEQFAGKDARIRAITQVNSGVGTTRNRGKSEVSPQAETVLFLDADDLLEPDALEKLYAALQERPEAIAVHGNVRFIDSESAFMEEPDARELARKRQCIEQGQLRDCPIEHPTTFEILAYTGVIWTPGQILIRRDALAKAGDFDNEIPGIEDWDMWIRLSLLGEIAFLDYPLLRCRRHENNLSSNNRRMRNSEYAMRRKHFASFSGTAAQRQTFFEGYQLHEAHHRKLRWEYAGECFKRGQIVTGTKQAILVIQSLLQSSTTGRR